ncbi:MAG: threonine/serine dehydratase [Kofleriaceae bacterium]|nr:threonine/serine dehydratase [Myxococcales bacterium]MCB9560229.1 threonine/serine dehydratase [Kofleriaceae bacterium]MCB9571206.1 threonine/serine dehydratase [Kofleriaceae bacterium]
MPWPITWDDVVAARARLAPHLPRTPLRHYPALDAELGGDVRVLVKHDNHLPTNAFKARNGLALLTALDADARRRGVVAATRGNHGAGLAWAGRLLGVPVTICVPHGNSPEKNLAIRGLGAELIEAGADYDAAVEAATRLVADRGLTMAHSTNDPAVIAGAATITAEILEQVTEPPLDGRLDAIVVAVGGGSQAVGALTAVRARRPDVAVYAVQAAGAPAIHDAWHAGRPLTRDRADTFADGLATRQTYALTFEALREGLADFITVDEDELAAAVRRLIRTTHNLAEGAGAAGLAGLTRLRDRLAGQTVAIILSGSNIDEPTLRRVLG